MPADVDLALDTQLRCLVVKTYLLYFTPYFMGRVTFEFFVEGWELVNGDREARTP
jgi:hypothetical protein